MAQADPRTIHIAPHLARAAVALRVRQDPGPLKALRMMAKAGKLTEDLQIAVAEHYGLVPTFQVLGILRDLSEE